MRCAGPWILALGLLAGAAWPQSLAQLAAEAAANPRDANVQYRLGQAQAAAGHLTAATEAYFRAHLAAPADAKAMAALARTYARIPNYEKAAYWYRKLLTLRPGDAKLTQEAAELALKHGQPLQAELLLKPALGRHPETLELWRLLATTYEALNLPSEALQCYEQVLRLSPPTLALRRHVIALYLQTGQAGRALPHVQAALRERPDDRELLRQWGEVELALGRAASAVAAFERLVSLAPSNPSYHLQLATALTQTGDVRRALHAYGRASELTQLSAETLLRMATLAAECQEWELSNRYLSLLVALEPASAEHRRLLAQQALQCGDRATAIIQYHELQRAGDAQAALDEVELVRELGGRDWALRRLRDLERTAPDHPNIALRVAMLLATLGETIEGAGLARKQLERGDLALADRVLGAQALTEAGCLSEAEAVLREILQSDPRHPAALLSLARVLQLRGAWSQSYDLLRGSYSAAPDNAEMALALQGAAARVGRLEAAAGLFRRFVESEPTNEVALRALVNTYRALGGTARSAAGLLELVTSRPNQSLWELYAARELAAAGRLREAARYYESLVKDPVHGPAAQTGLCAALLADERYGELLSLLSRLADAERQGAEAYALLTGARPPADLAGPEPTDATAQAARAAAVLFLSRPGTEDYYLAIADMCIATRSYARGVAWLTAPVTTPHQPAPTAAGLLRLQRHEGRAAEALDWLAKLDPQPRSALLCLEEVECLLATQRYVEAALRSEALLPETPGSLKPQAHFVCAEALRGGARKEEAAWHYAQALIGGHDPAKTTRRLCELCAEGGLTPQALMGLVQELWAAHQDEAALAVAASVSAMARYAEVRQWAQARSSGRQREP